MKLGYLGYYLDQINPRELYIFAGRGRRVRAPT